MRKLIVVTRVEPSRARGSRSALSVRFGTGNDPRSARRASTLELPKPAGSITRLAATIALKLRLARR
jgi:hypothetical protein